MPGTRSAANRAAWENLPRGCDNAITAISASVESRSVTPASQRCLVSTWEIPFRDSRCGYLWLSFPFVVAQGGHLAVTPVTHHLTVPRTARYLTQGEIETAEEVWFVLHGYSMLVEVFLK